MLVSRSTVVSYEGGGHHEYKRTVLSGSYARDGLIFLGFAILITAMRTYSRWRMVGFKGFQADDFLVWFALVSALFFFFFSFSFFFFFFLSPNDYETTHHNTPASFE